ncbi:MAG: hypothetical protein ACQER7_05545 [Bacteroidota bacterium]
MKLFNPKNGGRKKEKTLHALLHANGLIRYNRPRQNEAFPASLMFSVSSRAKRGVFFSPVPGTPVPEALKSFCAYMRYNPIVLND